MTTRDPKSGRFAATANVPSATEGTFPTMTDLPVDIQGGDPARLAYDSVPRPVQADDLAQGGQWPLHPRHPVLIDADERSRALYGSQGGRLRDAARLSGLDGMAGHVLGLYPPGDPSQGIQDDDGTVGPRTARLLPSMYQRPDPDPRDR
ncbi:MAG: hypothetical protein ACRDOI_21190 [Trebonia sp.]